MSHTIVCNSNSCSARVELPDVPDEDRLVLAYDSVSGDAFIVDAGPQVDITPAEDWTFSADEGWLCPRCTKET